MDWWFVRLSVAFGAREPGYAGEDDDEGQAYDETPTRGIFSRVVVVRRRFIACVPVCHF